MKVILMCVAVFVFNSKAVAISDSELAERCFAIGRKKVERQAKILGCQIDTDRIEVEGTDNRSESPSKYVWYRSAGACGKAGIIVQLVQYYRGECR